MSVFIVPTTADANYSQRSDLDGTEYVLTFRYNQREAAYYFSIGTPAGASIIEGVKVVCGLPLLAAYNPVGRPPGEFMAIAHTADDSPPKIGELGDGLRVALVYLSVT